ncbi:MAG: MMPL family transporter, partial [Gaiellaceae bacterium]
MSPLKHSKSFAARVGGWSARHWKTAVAGWLVFVVASVFVGMQVGTNQIKETDANVGESRTADRIISDGGFSLDKEGQSTEQQFEMVLIQSKTLTTAAPAFRAAIADTEATLRSFPQVTKLISPLGTHEGLVSKDRHSVLIQFTPKGSYEEVVAYIDTIVAAVDKTAAHHAAFVIDPAGVSTDKALDKEIQGGLAKAGMISIPLTIIVLMLVLGALVGALIPLFVALTSVVATTGLLALASQGVAADENIMEVVLLIGLAVGVDYSLFYMRREREERAAGRSETAALAAAAATSGRAVLLSGMTVLIAMAGMFLSGDKTFMSFSVGAMLVVAVAMFGSLTVLPALLSKLGDKVERGRIPFVNRLNRKQGEGRVWGALLDRVLRHPLISAVAATAVLLVLAIPTLSLHTTQTGIEGITSPSVAPFVRIMDAFPGAPDPAVVAIEADDVNAAPVRSAIADLERSALATGEMHG